MLTPDIQIILYQTWDYICRRVRHGAVAIYDTSAWREATAAVDTAALSGDVEATKVACRHWWGLLQERQNVT